MSTMDAWCPTADCYMSLGDGPASGISLTTGGGSVFTYSDVDTNIDANASLWLQSNADGGVVCEAGVTIGTPAGIKAAAGGKVDIWAGASTSPNVGGPDGPKGAPTAPTPPCGGTEAAVNRSNALNSAVKGASDIYSGISDLASGDSSALEKAAGAWDAAKGAWDVAKAGHDAGAYDMEGAIGKNTMNGIEGGMGLVDAALGVAKGDIPNVVGAMQSGSKLLNAMGGEQGADGSGGGAAGGAGGHSGGSKIEARAPAGIKKLTDANMEAFVGQKIEYKAGTNIVMNAANKVETCSMVFEAHANIAATMKGLARAKVESLGKAVLDGKATFKVSTAGVGKIESGGTLAIDAKGIMTIESKALIDMKGNASVDIESSGGITLKGPEVDIDTPKTTCTGKLTVVKSFVNKGDTTIDKSLTVKQGGSVAKNLSVGKNLKVSGNVLLG